MNYFNKKRVFKSTIALIIVGAFLAGIYIGRVSNERYGVVGGVENLPVSRGDFNIFWEVWRYIENKYVDRGALNKQDMIYGAVSGLVKSLDDPYSVFLEPDDSKRFKDDVSGQFGGIGAEIGIRDGILTIIAPLEGTPAKKAGLLAGDKILKIGETMTTDLNLDEAVNLIRGERWTEVVLTIIRDGLNEAEEINVIRDIIDIPIIKLEYIDKENFKIAHLRLYHFTSTATQEFKNKAREIIANNVNGLILDLRNNPGGYLEVAADLSSYFLEKDRIVAIESFGTGERQEYKSTGINILGSLPTVILVNEGSASASEIMAGALRDNKEIKLIGEKTFGKGSVQELENFANGSSVKLTIAKWLTPKGVSINDEGIKPDFEVKLAKEDIDQDKDPQLDKAVGALLEQLIINNNK